MSGTDLIVPTELKVEDLKLRGAAEMDRLPDTCHLFLSSATKHHGLPLSKASF